MKKPLLLLFSLFTFSLSQAQQPFITTWEVPAGDLEITIPTNTDDYAYNYTIDFGDGTVLNNQTGDVTHTYSSPGLYTVSISGLFPHFYGSELVQTGGWYKLKSIEQWGSINWKSMEEAFLNCNMIINATDAPDLSQVFNMTAMFKGTYFNQSIDHWDVSNITLMSELFSNSKYNSSLNSWNTSSVIDMSRMFYQADFNKLINNWDVSSVTDMSEMFYQADFYNQPLNDWNVSNVTNMKYMFSSSGFNQPINNWDVANVVDMSYMFYFSDFFNQNINNWDVSSVIDMNHMFSYAAFNQPINSWNVSNVTNMSRMFQGAWNFNQSLNNWDVSNVINMIRMFTGTYAFNQPLNNWDVSNVLSMTAMFSNAPSFNQPLNNWDVSNVTSMRGMFEYADSFNQPLNNWDVSNVNNLKFMFLSADAFNQNLSSWNFATNDLSFFISDTSISSLNYDLVIDKLVQLNISNGFLGAANIEYCDSFSRQQLINTGWTVFDGGQASGCDLNYISGVVLYDDLNDGCNSSDVVLSNFLIYVNNGTDDVAFDMGDNGNYVIGLDAGNYSLSILNLDSNYSSTPISQTVNFSGQDEILENIDFCITANQQFDDLSIDIFPLEDAIPGFETDYQVIVSNNGTQTVPNVQVTFGYDESFQTYVSSTIPTSGTSTDLLTFQFPNLKPFSQEVFEITMLNAIPPTLNGGEVLTFTTQVTPDANDIDIKDNTTSYDQTVVNSFDPNDKMVVQGDEIVDEDIDQYLDYRIRFQNLGTANALNVKITDTIDNNLDWTTFQPITSSHDYRIEIVDGEQINYYFDNINLPFETADPEGSNGYITYRIKPKPTVQIGDTFENTAYIYFDFNLPIITNTVVTTVVDNLSIDAFDFNSVSIYPNPVSDKLFIESLNTLESKSIKLFDLQGKIVKTFKGQSELDLSDLENGVYILKLETDQGSYNQKVIKE